MIVSGLVYTFVALLSMLFAIASVLFGVYMVSLSVAQAWVWEFDRASALFLQAMAMGAAAYVATSFAHYMSTRGMEMMDAVGEDENGEEYLYIDESEEGEENG